MSFPKIAIFIPTYNDRDDLMACIESLRHLNYPKEQMAIVIWDNNSTDKTIRDVKERFSRMEHEGWAGLLLIEWKKNEGSYIPYNLSLPLLPRETQFILGLDADVEPAPDVLLHMTMSAQEESVAVVGARSVFFDNPDTTSHGAGFVNRWTGRYSEKDADARVECDFVIGCCWLLRKEVFEQLSGFDANYYINHWEVDYCLRAIERGFRIVYEPKAVVKHKISPGGTINKGRLYYLYRNKTLLFKKLFPVPWRWTALCFYLLFGFPMSVIQSIKRNGRADARELKFICKAFTDGLLNRTGKTV
ncbi:MAG TPA: glycosyltransferase family 2 protein [Syntrophales bacterium]|nr:glycosyltransferase family 2 protein [Syntrophales bacterium]